jgi:hypothetical protein
MKDLFWRVRARWIIWRYRSKTKLTPRQKIKVLSAQAQICRQARP